MGLLVEGEWKDQWYDTDKHGGRFVREDAGFRNWITPDGSAGPTGEAGFPAETGRYHLYVCHACPWAHRTLIFRELKGLTEMIGVSAVSPDMLEDGWAFDREHPDHLYGSEFLHQIYTRAVPDYTGRVTTPTLWDREKETIVSNESADIIRMFDQAFDDLGANPGDHRPEELRDEIDRINERVYHDVNNGVYKTGFATTQEAYEEAFDRLFATLEWLDGLLSERRYLAGSRITEADWRLFTSLVRFDAVYHGHFKCNLHRISDFPNLSGYLRELYQWPGIAEITHFDEIKRHYYFSHGHINPTRVVPKGPRLDLDRPHGRDTLS